MRANSLGSAASSVVRSAIKRTQPWEDVELGPLIGAGSFGKVYRGVWNGAHVAVKARPPRSRARSRAARPLRAARSFAYLRAKRRLW